MKPSELLTKSLELLGPNGEHWIKGSYREVRAPSEDGFCSYGALREATWSDYDNPERSVRDVDYFSAAYDERCNARTAAAAKLAAAAQADSDPAVGARFRIIRFNDDPGTEWPQVKAAFTKAIELALAQESEQA